jgi:hypothetical protein
METTTQPEDKNVCIPDTRWNRYQYLKLCFRGTPRPEVFPIGSSDQEDTRIIGQDVAYTIDANYHKGTNTLAKSRRSLVGDAINLNAQEAKIRRLTPIECERLQGFPDGFTEFGIDIKELVTYKKCGNIEIWNKAQIEKIRNQYVRFRVVLENKKPISVIASCTTNDGSEMELPSCQNVNSNPKVSVHIAIDRLEQSERWGCVINITKCGDSMVTRYTLRRNDNGQVEMATSEIATDGTLTPKSWKPILEENSEKTKLSTISTQINWIIESLISTYAHAQSMELSMHNSDGLSKTESTWEISYLKTVSTERISDSSRYKMCRQRSNYQCSSSSI